MGWDWRTICADQGTVSVGGCLLHEYGEEGFKQVRYVGLVGVILSNHFGLNFKLFRSETVLILFIQVVGTWMKSDSTLS